MSWNMNARKYAKPVGSVTREKLQVVSKARNHLARKPGKGQVRDRPVGERGTQEKGQRAPRTSQRSHRSPGERGRALGPSQRPAVGAPSRGASSVPTGKRVDQVRPPCPGGDPPREMNHSGGYEHNRQRPGEMRKSNRHAAKRDDYRLKVGLWSCNLL